MSPRSSEQFERIRQRSREAIKEAALELFGHQGYESTSISRIAREAGVSKGLLYNYFDSKAALLEEVLMDAVHLGERLLGEIVQSATGPRDIIRGIIDHSFDNVRENLHYWKLLTAVAFQTELLEERVPKLREKMLESTEELTGLFEQLGYDHPREEAMLFSAAMDGIFIHYLQWGDAYPLEPMQNFLRDRYAPEPNERP